MLGHRHHLASCPATPRSPAWLLRSARYSTSMAVAVPRHLLGNNEVPARLLRGARRPIILIVTVAWHLARQHQEVPRCFCAGQVGQHLWPSPSPAISLATTTSPRGFSAGRGGLYSWPLPSSGISPGDAKNSRAASARGEAANIYRRRRRPGISFAMPQRPRAASARVQHRWPSPLNDTSLKTTKPPCGF